MKYRNEVRPDTPGRDSQRVKHGLVIGDKIKGTDAMSETLIQLEEIAEMPDEALMEPRYTERSLSELRKAAEKSPDLKRYFDTLFRNPYWTLRDIGCCLGWSDNKARAVDRQYRRLLQRIKELGLGIEYRTSPHSGVSHARQTTYFEVLGNGKWGKRFGLIQHKPLKTSDK